MFDIDDLLSSGLGGVWQNFIDTGGGGSAPGGDDTGFAADDDDAGSGGSDDFASMGPYFAPRTDGPFTGWSDAALDNLQGSLSQADYGAFLLDRAATFGANTMNQDQDEPPLQPMRSYEPADYGAPAAAQASDAGQATGPGAGSSDAAGPNTAESASNGWFLGQGPFQNQTPAFGVGMGGQADNSDPSQIQMPVDWNARHPDEAIQNIRAQINSNYWQQQLGNLTLSPGEAAMIGYGGYAGGPAGAADAATGVYATKGINALYMLGQQGYDLSQHPYTSLTQPTIYDLMGS
jgi:hypothetical protein